MKMHRPESPDLFGSPESSPLYELSKQDHIVLDIEDGVSECQLDNKEWRGTSMYDILHDNNPWNYYTSPISPSRHHTVLFQLPVTLNSPPKSHYSSKICHWNNDHVKMPFSPKNLYPVKEGNEEVIKPRWDIIQMALLKPIMSSVQLEEAISSYNLRKCFRLHSLHYLFQEILDPDESQHFFSVLLPKIVQLALQLPELISSSIPLLKQGKAHSVSLSQLQIASLLANAFLCTFPWRKEMNTYPGLNFNTLFECKCELYLIEKIKCLMHYFRRVCNKTPIGVVTFERKYLPRSQLPRWDRLDTNIGNTKLHISSTGTIEDGGLGLLQVDFANNMVGGGVLGWGCVQEEIRFLICPELLVSRLFTEQLGPTEALLITGVECFSKYKGYADTFEWAGNCDDETPFDLSGRRRTSIIAIDAIYYSNRSVQFSPSKMIRELNKAYVGFCEDASIPRASIPAVATGNWGCGAFRGNLHLKALLQIMACTAANRDIAYYTFGDSKLRDVINSAHQFLTTHNITVAQLWRYLCRFNETHLPHKHLLSYIQQAHLDSLSNGSKESVKKCFIEKMDTFSNKTNTFSETNISSSKSCHNSELSTKSTYLKTNAASMDMEVEEDIVEAGTSQNSDAIIIESSQDVSKKPAYFKKNYISSSKISKPKIRMDEQDSAKKHKKILAILYSSEEEDNTQDDVCIETSLLSAADSFKKSEQKKNVDTSTVAPTLESSSKKNEKCQLDSRDNIPEFVQRTPLKLTIQKNKEKIPVNKKISDYFKKIPK